MNAPTVLVKTTGYARIRLTLMHVDVYKDIQEGIAKQVSQLLLFL